MKEFEEHYRRIGLTGGQVRELVEYGNDELMMVGYDCGMIAEYTMILILERYLAMVRENERGIA